MVTENTLLTSLETRLKAHVWTGTSNKVFGAESVVPCSDAESAMRALLLAGRRTPLCIIASGDGESDPKHGEEPNLVRLRITIRLVVLIPGDEAGRAALVGGYKVGGATKSEGKGLTELGEIVHDSIGYLNAEESFQIQFSGAGKGGSQPYDAQNWLAWQDERYEAWVTKT